MYLSLSLPPGGIANDSQVLPPVGAKVKYQASHAAIVSLHNRFTCCIQGNTLSSPH